MNNSGFLWDFSNVSSAARVFLSGKDPFQIDNVQQAWVDAPHSRGWRRTTAVGYGVVPVYPPPSLVMVAPWALLSPPMAHVLWVLSDVALMVLVCIALCRLGGSRPMTIGCC